MIREGAKFCSVKMYCNEWGFLWEKGAGINRYTYVNNKGDIILDANNKPKILDKVGFGQIDEITKIGFGSIEVGDSLIQPWYASQFDPIFLLNKSGPAVTDFFSEVAHLQVLQDGVIISVRRRKRSLDEASIKADDTVKLRTKEAQFEGLDAFIQITEELKQQAESINTYETKIKNGQEIMERIYVTSDTIYVLEKKVTLPEKPEESLIDNLQKMTRLWTSLDESAHRIAVLRNITKANLPKPPDASAVKDLINISRIGSEISKERSSIETLSANIPIPNVDIKPEKLAHVVSIYDQIKQIKSDEKEFKHKLKLLDTQISQTQKDINAIPSCTVCGRPTIQLHSHA
jgi:hypothetical protein